MSGGRAVRIAGTLAAMVFGSSWCWAETPTASGSAVKRTGMLFPAQVIEAARANAATLPWGRSMKEQIVKMAEPWAKMSDEELWELMFGPTIRRSWMVWSNGHCPACDKGVPMYNWEADALNRPWKMQCPHCKELFPKNDFEKFYRSGLD